MYIDFKNFFSATGITPEKFSAAAEKIIPYLSKISKRNQGWYSIFEDKIFLEEVEKIKTFSTSVAGKYTDIVICGIGGSALGTITLRDSLTPFGQHSSPRLHVVENIDPDMMMGIANIINIEKTLLIVISKSGGTPETIAQYFFFKNIIDQKNLKAKEHIAMITGPTGFLREEVEKFSLQNFSVPENIGGRFSVLTAVGLLPACLIGIDIDELLEGGQQMSQQFLSENFEENLPFQLAMAQILSKKPNHILMPYASRLRTFSAWFVQLLAESTGKDRKGFTPIAALGATDQHSQLQLFSDGPLDKLMMFIHVENFEKDPQIPVLTPHKKTKFLENVSFKTLLHAEEKAISTAMTEKKVPNFTINIEKISAHNIGKLFVLFEGATAFLGEELEINAFDQPGVERGKILTREILGQ